MTPVIILPIGTKEIRLIQLPGLIADALYPPPADASTVRILGKSIKGLGVIEPLTDTDYQAIAQLFDGDKFAALTPEIWLPKVIAISEAIGADIRWDIDKSEPREISHKRSMVRLEHEEALAETIRSGKLVARTSSRMPIQLPDGVRQFPLSAIVLLDDLRQYAEQFGIKVKYAEQSSHAKDKALPKQIRQRQDALAVELAEILISMETRTPAKVMAKLREKIGKPNTCILSNVGDGIKWENNSGNVKTLTITRLNERIREWKKTGLRQG